MNEVEVKAFQFYTSSCNILCEYHHQINFMLSHRKQDTLQDSRIQNADNYIF